MSSAAAIEVLDSALPPPLVHPQATEYPPNTDIDLNPTDNPDIPQRPARRPISGQSYAEWRRHVYWQAYCRAEEAYDYMDGTDSGTRLRRLRECGSMAWFVRDKESGQIFVESNSCGLRWCPMCAARVRKVSTVNAAEWIRHVNRPKFLTLTLKHTNAPLGHQVTHLYRYFALLRKRLELKPLFKGGIWFFQIKFNAEYQQFHPHLHVILDGKRTPRVLISEMWLDVTGDSCVIDIRAVHDVDKAAAEVARYAATPCSLTKLDLPWAMAVVKELNGRKLCGTFGTARNVHLRQKVEHPAENKERIASFGVIIDLAKEDYDAALLITALQNREPVEADVVSRLCNKFSEQFGVVALHFKPRPPPENTLFQ